MRVVYLQNVPREHAICSTGTVRANRSEASSLLAVWTQVKSSYFTTDGQWTELRRLLNCLEVDPSENTARNNTCCFCWLPWKSCLSGSYLDTDLHKRYLVTGIPNMWEVSMEGSHTTITVLDLAKKFHAWTFCYVQEIEGRYVTNKVVPYVITFNDNYCLLRSKAGESSIKAQTFLRSLLPSCLARSLQSLPKKT
jgi:hypothetical protein